MKKLHKLAAAVGALWMMGSSAQGADLYTPMPEPVPAYAGGWYFSAFGGANWLDNTSFDIGAGTVANDYDTGFVVGGAIGYDMGPAMGPFGLRLEAELSYRDNDVNSHSVGGAANPSRLAAHPH